jgi:hypothetical protein
LLQTTRGCGDGPPLREWCLGRLGTLTPETLTSPFCAPGRSTHLRVLSLASLTYLEPRERERGREGVREREGERERERERERENGAFRR